MRRCFLIAALLLSSAEGIGLVPLLEEVACGESCPDDSQGCSCPPGCACCGCCSHSLRSLSLVQSVSSNPFALVGTALPERVIDPPSAAPGEVFHVPKPSLL